MLGSFNYAGEDRFPLETVDLVADNLIGWLDHQGFTVVAKALEADDEPLPEVEGNLPSVFDFATGTLLLFRDADHTEVPSGPDGASGTDRLASDGTANQATMTTDGDSVEDSGGAALNKRGTEEGGTEDEQAPVTGADETVACSYCDDSGVVGGVGTSDICPACMGAGRLSAEADAAFDPENFEWRWNSVRHFKSDMFDYGFQASEFDHTQYDLRAEAGSDADWSSLAFRGADLRGFNLNGANLSRCNLNGADLSGANLAGANLSGADLCYADLSVATCTGADFTGGDLSSAKLTGVTCAGARFADATLAEANFADADFGGADFTGADLTDAFPSEAASLAGTRMAGALGLSEEERAACRAMGAVVDDRTAGNVVP